MEVNEDQEHQMEAVFSHLLLGQLMGGPGRGCAHRVSHDRSMPSPSQTLQVAGPLCWAVGILEFERNVSIKKAKQSSFSSKAKGWAPGLSLFRDGT